MGAVFNNGLLVNEPGGFTHRPLYVKRLIYDSIQWLASLRGYTNVADAIQALVNNNSMQIIVTAQNASKRTYSLERPNAKITQEMANAAIVWLYGSTPTTPAAKQKRPGDL
jgi:hypothetical protein